MTSAPAMQHEGGASAFTPWILTRHPSDRLHPDAVRSAVEVYFYGERLPSAPGSAQTPHRDNAVAVASWLWVRRCGLEVEKVFALAVGAASPADAGASGGGATSGGSSGGGGGGFGQESDRRLVAERRRVAQWVDEIDEQLRVPGARQRQVSVRGAGFMAIGQALLLLEAYAYGWGARGQERGVA